MSDDVAIARRWQSLAAGCQIGSRRCAGRLSGCNVQHGHAGATESGSLARGAHRQGQGCGLAARRHSCGALPAVALAARVSRRVLRPIIFEALKLFPDAGTLHLVV